MGGGVRRASHVATAGCVTEFNGLVWGCQGAARGFGAGFAPPSWGGGPGRVGVNPDLRCWKARGGSPIFRVEGPRHEHSHQRLSATARPVLKPPGAVVIDGAEALALYERNWRFVDREAMGADEVQLLDVLVKVYGNGVLNV